MLRVSVLIVASLPFGGCTPPADAGAEQRFIACMADRGFEVTSVSLTPGREDVQLAPHDRPLEEVVAATADCEALALGGTVLELSGENLQQDVDTVVAQVANGGVIAILVQDGTTTTAVAGTANRNGDPLALDSQLNIASTSKAFTAAAVYRLEDREMLSTDQPLSTYLPDLGFGPEVTLDALLAHRSGIPDYAQNPDYLADVVGDPDRVFSPRDLLDYARELRPGTPGSFAYSNTGFVLLGLVVEEVTGDRLAQVMRDEIVEPLGLTHTSLVEPPDFPDALVSAWVDAASLGLPTSPPPPVMPFSSALSGCQADCGIVTTAGEARVFKEALLDGSLLSQGALTTMTTPGEEAPGYGRGLEIYEGRAGQPTYGHGGGGAGYSTRIALDPATGDLIVLLANNDALQLNALFEAYRP